MNHIAGVAEFERSFGVSRETLKRLEVYSDLLVTWQKTINLVAPSTLGDVWHRHFADSAQLIRLAPERPLVWIDLGSGGGFPGLVVAILLAERRGSRVTLVESDARKCAFLREVVRKTGLNAVSRDAVAVDIVTQRIESFANTRKEGAVDVVSARALAPLERLLDWCAPFFGPQTVGLLPKGRDVEAELAAARRKWQFDCHLQPSVTEDDGRIVVVRDLRRV